MENKTEVKNMQIASLTIPASTRDSLTYLFRRHPFTIYSPKVNLTQDELYKIYKTDEYFFLYTDEDHSLILSKNGFEVGNPEAFDLFIKKKCPLKYKK